MSTAHFSTIVLCRRALKKGNNGRHAAIPLDMSSCVESQSCMLPALALKITILSFHVFPELFL